jgi:hypothetical protein
MYFVRLTFIPRSTSIGMNANKYMMVLKSPKDLGPRILEMARLAKKVIMLANKVARNTSVPLLINSPSKNGTFI